MSYIYDPKSNIEIERLQERDKRTTTRRTAALNGMVFHNVKSILDVGCGSGVAGFELLRRTESASLVDLDLEYSILFRALESSPNRYTCNYVAGDGLDLPFTNATFDLVLSQYLLQHVSNPIGILKEMRRVSCKDARLIIFEWDDGVNFSYPQMPTERKRLFDAKIELVNRGGGDRYIGRKLYHHISTAGWSDVEIKIIHDIWKGPNDRREKLKSTELSFLQLRPQLLENGYLTETEIKRGIEQLYEYYCGDIFSVVFFFSGFARNPE